MEHKTESLHAFSFSKNPPSCLLSLQGQAQDCLTLQSIISANVGKLNWSCSDSPAVVCTHAASLQQQLTFAETVGAVGEFHQSFLCLVSDGGVGGLVQLLTQDLQLGEALDKTEGDSAGLSASRSRLESFIVSDKQITADKTGGHAELYTLIITDKHAERRLLQLSRVTF